MKAIALMGMAAAAVVLAGCSSCGCKAPAPKCGKCVAKTIAVKKDCRKCKLVYADGTPADCCRTVTKFSH